jgi:hypothetical protein
VMVSSRPKVSFWPDGTNSPGNYGWLLVYTLCQATATTQVTVRRPLLGNKSCLQQQNSSRRFLRGPRREIERNTSNLVCISWHLSHS